MAAVCGVGFLTTLFMKDHPLHVKTDTQWGLKEAKDNVHANQPRQAQPGAVSLLTHGGQSASEAFESPATPVVIPVQH